MYEKLAVLEAPPPLSAPAEESSPAAASQSAPSSTVPWFIKLLLLIDIGLGFAYVGSYVLFTHILPDEHTFYFDAADADRSITFHFTFSSRLFDLDSEQNVPTWYASIKLLAIAVLLTCFAYHMRKRRMNRRTLWLAGGLFFVLSLDEYAQLHDTIGIRAQQFFEAWPVTSSFTMPRMWVVFFVPPLLIAAVVIWRGLRPFLVGRSQVARRFLLGFGIFVASAAGIELFYNLMDPDSIGVQVEILFEEVGELIGVTLMLWAAYTLLVSHGLRPRVSGASRNDPAAEDPSNTAPVSQ